MEASAPCTVPRVSTWSAGVKDSTDSSSTFNRSLLFRMGHLGPGGILNLAHAGMRTPNRRTCRAFDKFPTPSRTSRVGGAGTQEAPQVERATLTEAQDVLAATEQIKTLQSSAPPDSKSPDRTRSGRGFFVPASNLSDHISPAAGADESPRPRQRWLLIVDTPCASLVVRIILYFVHFW
jgi:hypothetical protein